jgi:bifunctional UDP-N-acetylglucosamine pyrophosphorylase / glucosamine-1-phosphate N-acetyltransferase
MVSNSSLGSRPSVASSSTQFEKPMWGIILAAGQGKRMKTDRPKVAHEVLGRPLVIWAIESMRQAGIRTIAVVLSPNQKSVIELVKKYEANFDVELVVALQEIALGTGHAALCGLNELIKNQKISESQLNFQNVLIGFGDTPAVRPETFGRFVTQHLTQQNDVTVFAFRPPMPFGYGRILKTASGDFLSIREEKDCSEVEKLEQLCNSGLLCANAKILVEVLPHLSTQNASGEHYLTDVPAVAKKVGIYESTETTELQGVNSQSQLAEIAEFMQFKILEKHMDNGVQFLDPKSVYLEPTVKVSEGVIVEPYVYLAGEQVIKKGERVLFGTCLR